MNALLGFRRCARPFHFQPETALVAFALSLMLPPVGALAEDGIPTGWVCFDGVAAAPVAPRMDIVSSSSDELVLNIDVPGVLTTDLKEGGIDFQKLEFPGYYRSTEVGHPALPVVRQLLAVPAGCTVDVSVSIPDSIKYWDSIVYPVPALVTRYTEDGYEYLAEEFAYDEGAYSARGYYPTQVASVGSPGVLRGQGVVLLTVYPIQFDASSDLIRVLPLLTVTLTFTGGSGGVSGDLGPFDSIAEGVLLNYEGHGSRSGRAQADTGKYGRCSSVYECAVLKADYLMIVQDSLYASSWVDSLAKHRAEYNCYNVAIVSGDVVGTPIDDGAIRGFIQDVYETESAEHMSDSRLGYVLLVGDAREGEPNDFVPAHEETVSPWVATTDHWYACVDDTDAIADLMIGRLCASDTEELRIEVQRFVGYEEAAATVTLPAEPSWRDSVLLSCGFAWRNCTNNDSLEFAVSVHATFDSLEAFLSSRGYEIHENHAHEQSGASCVGQRRNTSRLNVDEINRGRHIVQLCTHGARHEADNLKHDHIDSLSNAGMLPFWMSYACNTGAYDEVIEPPSPPEPTHCLGERLLHQLEDAGAVAYLGASEGSYNVAWEFLGKYMWRGLLNEHRYEIGQCLAYAKLSHLSKTGDTRHVYMYNLLGDPALNLRLVGHYGYSSAPDFVVTQSDLSSVPLYPSVNDTVQLRAVVHNRSNYTPDGSVQVVFKVCEADGDEGGCEVVGSDSVLPQAWSSDTASVSWIPDDYGEAGRRLVKVEIDTSSTELFKDNNSASRPLSVCFEPDGFPVQIGGAGGLSPTVVDATDDPGLEVLAVTRQPGNLTALSSDGSILWRYPTEGSVFVHGAPAVADVDSSGSMEVIVSCDNSVVALNAADGSLFWTPPFFADQLVSPPAVGDFAAGDGLLEVSVERHKVQEIGTSYYALVISSTGSELSERPLNTASGCRFALESSPAVADINRDGRVDVVSSRPWGTAHSGKLAVVDGETGQRIWTPDVELGTWGDQASPDVQPCSPIAADIVSDSVGLEVLCGAHSLVCVSAPGNEIWHRPLCGFLSGLAVVDLDSDGDTEIVAACYGSLDDPGGRGGHVYVFDEDAGGWSVVDSIAVEYQCVGQPVVADLDGDGQSEIVVASSSRCRGPAGLLDMSHLDILTFDSTTGTLERDLLEGRPVLLWESIYSTPAIADADEDGSLEIWVVDGTGYVHCLEYWEAGEPSRWMSYQHDERHTGTYETPVCGAYPESSTVSWWGDYSMSGDVLVDSTSTIRVQPGTTVRVTPHNDDAAGDSLGIDPDLTELIVKGTLRASGTRRSPTSFIPESAGLGLGSPWRGIRLPRRSSDGELHVCTITDAYVGIDADSARVIVERCTLRYCDPIGIRCRGNTGQSEVALRRNTLEAGHVGIELHNCAAQADSNTVLDFLSYGFKIYQDRGSTVEWNYIEDPLNLTYPFSGVYAQGSHDTLRIRYNEFKEVRTCGIEHEMRVSGQDEIRGNCIEANIAKTSCAKGMYFYNSNASVRENTVEHARYPFWVEIDGGSTPDLGDTTVSDGNNSVYDEARVSYFVRAVEFARSTVKAENNYWAGETDTLLQDRFFGSVDYDPCLENDPNGDRQDVEDVHEATPNVFAFRQNHPNPFNPSTVLSFSVPEKIHVRLRVYDLSGRLVTTLVDAGKDPGWHEVIWDGTSAHGLSVASGVYFCRLEAGSYVASQKVVVLK